MVKHAGRIRLLLALLLSGSLLVVGMSSAKTNAAWLGIVVTYQDEAALGEGRMTVATVFPDSPASTAGLKVDDIISRVNGVSFRFDNWTATVANGGPFAWAKPGDILRLSILRAGKTMMIELVALAPPTAIIEEQRAFQAKIHQKRGFEVFDELAKQGAILQIERPTTKDPIQITAAGLAANDAASLADHLSNSPMRSLFSNLEPGAAIKLKLSVEPETGRSRVHVLQQ